MNTKLQELTNKVYEEGIEKAQKESDSILKEANSKAKEIVRNAEKQRESILIKAEEDANSFKRKVASEVQLGARQMVGKLRQDLQILLKGQVIETPISNTFSDPNTLKELIKKSIESVQFSKDGNIKISLSEKDSSTIGDSIKNDIHKQFNLGVSIHQDKSLKQGFKIGPENGNYLISFSDEDFSSLFGQYLRKETQEIING